MADHLLPVFLKPAEKRALDLVSDWPWITLTDLAGLLGVSGRGPPSWSTRWRASATRADAWPSPTGG